MKTSALVPANANKNGLAHLRVGDINKTKH